MTVFNVGEVVSECVGRRMRRIFVEWGQCKSYWFFIELVLACGFYAFPYRHLVRFIVRWDSVKIVIEITVILTADDVRVRIENQVDISGVLF